MIRTGKFDAHQKLAFVRARAAGHGPDPAIVASDLVDRWFGIARLHGGLAAVRYLEDRARTMVRMTGDTLPATLRSDADFPFAGSIDREIARGFVAGGKALLAAIAKAASPLSNGGQTEGAASRALMERLRDVFFQGALNGLAYTLDEGEVPSRDELEQVAGPFPTGLLAGCDRLLCLFGAYYYGKNDAIHAFTAGIADVTLVDLDEERTALMASIYPARWTYVVADYIAFLQARAAAGEIFDVVVADPWTTMMREVGWDRLTLLIGVCSGTLITGYAAEMFDELQVDPKDLAALSAAISARSGCDVIVRDVKRRNDQVAWVALSAAP